jgi:2-keto-4-pentenoate hydratase
VTRDLVELLWEARAAGTTVEPRELTLDEARATLAALTRRAVAEGEEVVGWKIARLPDRTGQDVLFAGPVFASSLGPADRPLVAPRFEVEHVARVEALDPLRLSWHLGLEVVDNHAPDWRLDPAWALADWGVHGGAVLGQPCAPPLDGVPRAVELRIGAEHRAVEGAWRTGLGRMAEVLERDAAALLQPLRPGDLVWSGSLLPPTPVLVGLDVVARVADLGEVRLDATTFWGPGTPR